MFLCWCVHHGRKVDPGNTWFINAVSCFQSRCSTNCCLHVSSEKHYYCPPGILLAVDRIKVILNHKNIFVFKGSRPLTQVYLTFIVLEFAVEL